MSIVKKTFEKGAQKCTQVKKELRYKKCAHLEEKQDSSLKIRNTFHFNGGILCNGTKCTADS